MQTSQQGLHRVQDQISSACLSAGRTPAQVTLVAVSKTHGADVILPLLQAGHRVFGENRVQEAKQKWPALKEQFSGIELHLVGPLQTNKAAEAVAFFDAIQSVDREKLVAELAMEMAKQKRHPKLYVQVNTGAEPQKAGIEPQALSFFLEIARNKYNITFEGLMCIPPIDENPVPHFRMLAELAKGQDLRALSMGMSSDFPEAIAEGSTHVRVGSAIFGVRPAASLPVAK